MDQNTRVTMVEISDEAWDAAVQRLTLQQARKVERDVRQLQAEMEAFFGSKKETEIK